MSVINEVASNSRLSEIAMLLGRCDMGGGESTSRSVSGSGSTTVDEVDVEDCSLFLLLVVLVCFIANNLIRSCCSKTESPTTDNSGVGVGDGVSCVELSLLVEPTLPLLCVISGLEVGYLSEGGGSVGVRFRWTVSGASE